MLAFMGRRKKRRPLRAGGAISSHCQDAGRLPAASAEQSVTLQRIRFFD